MHYRYLDMETYKRKDHFLYFNSLAFPYVGLTANVDITELLQKIKAKRGQVGVFSDDLLLCPGGG